MVRTYKRMYSNARKGQQHKPYRVKISASLEEAGEEMNANQLSRKQAVKMYSITISTFY